MSELNSTALAETAAETPARGPAFSRLNLILAAILLAQAALIAYRYWPSGSTISSGAKLLAGIAMADINTVSIADNTGKSINLERSGDGWAVAGTDGFPANGEKVETSLTKLLDVAADRLVTRTIGSQGRLQVANDDFERRVTLGTTSGERVLYLGSSAGAGATHVRLDGQDETYLTGELAAWELDTAATGWLDNTYVNVPVDEVTAMKLINSNGEFAFTRVNTDTWTMNGLTEGEEVISANINTLANRAAFVTLNRPLGKTEQPEYGMAQPIAALILTATDDAGVEKTHTLTLGAKDEANNDFYFKSSDSPFYVTIAGFTGDEFSGKQRTDFAHIPTPEEGALPAAGDAAIPEPEATDSNEAAATDVPDAGMTEPAPESTTDAGASPTEDIGSSTPVPTAGSTSTPMP